MNTSDYPAQWERTARTRDGVAFRIRPIRPDDLERERSFMAGLSSTSRYNRLMSVVREVPLNLLDRFVHVDYHRSMAFVAVIGEPQNENKNENERIVGVARYAAGAQNADSCEFAVAVADKWQSRGVGAILTRLLFEYARTQGFRRVFGLILGGNTRMAKLAEFLEMDTHRAPEDGTLLEASRAL